MTLNLKHDLAGCLALAAATVTMTLPLSITGATARADAIQTTTQATAPSAESVLNHIHHINQAEIHLANLALERTRNAQVRSFADRMIKDHTAADQKTEQLAKTKDVALQSFQPSDQEKSTTDKLEQLKGTQFDSLYMKTMKSGHQQALRYLRDTTHATQDPELKSLIAELTPTVQHHERLAANIVANQHELAGKSGQ